MPQAKRVYDLDVTALAVKTNYNPNYVRWLAQEKTIPGKKINGKWFFSWDEVASHFTTQARANGSDNGTQSKTEVTDLLS